MKSILILNIYYQTLNKMFFTIIAPISKYIQQNFSGIFQKTVTLSPIIPIYDSDDDDTLTHHIIIHIGCQFSTQEELDALV